MTPVSSQATPIIKEKWGFQKAECWRSKGSFCWTTTAPQGCNYRCTTAKWCVDNFCPALFLLELPPHHSSLVQEAPWSSTASVCNGNIQEPLLKLLPTTWWNPPASPKQLLTEANSCRKIPAAAGERPGSLCCHPQVQGCWDPCKTCVTFKGKKFFLFPRKSFVLQALSLLRGQVPRLPALPSYVVFRCGVVQALVLPLHFTCEQDCYTSTE